MTCMRDLSHFVSPHAAATGAATLGVSMQNGHILHMGVLFSIVAGDSLRDFMREHTIIHLNRVNGSIKEEGHQDDAKWVFISSQANSSNLIRYSQTLSIYDSNRCFTKLEVQKIELTWLLLPHSPKKCNRKGLQHKNQKHVNIPIKHGHGTIVNPFEHVRSSWYLKKNWQEKLHEKGPLLFLHIITCLR
jgi:hypothetical protein